MTKQDGGVGADRSMNEKVGRRWGGGAGGGEAGASRRRKVFGVGSIDAPASLGSTGTAF